ncbi:vacuolar aminopeptidase [Suhomyces tanzawaensis NRRL Y-17324]|uniref:Vacuolar aminopeptidase n=1 Tax=Suhomyces tanzawaensis NRRL Y-17324 TaxID=984487 RepID=A0A1E4SG85_9ASCO|nr:vacuolar aminopeptidase [Suhomyces tanzawaensis NRRL Y-17324]ODV78480.1 vacuolar aminopeptidase [Suhomyces tanzawaensis NRRL Y-17324]
MNKDISLVLKDLLQAIENTQAPQVASAPTNATTSSANAVSTSKPILAYSQEYIDFTYTSPTIYHVVAHFKKQLGDAGFSYVSEQEDWSKLSAGKYFTIRNGSALAAFVVGKNWKPANGIGAIVSHIDSLTAKLKPASVKQSVEGYELLGVAPYAGTLGWLWYDRDLGLGGKVLVKQDGKVTAKLVDSTPHPIAHIPTLAPHFGEPSQSSNRETNSVPVVGYSAGKQEEATDEEKSAPLYGKHSLTLLRYVANKLGVKVSEILQWDLEIYDIQKGTIGGLNDEFLYAPRIDDRICSWAGIQALIEAEHDDLLASDSFSVVGLFDHEEISSLTRTGIKGGLVELVVSRVVQAVHPDKANIEEELRLTYANSFIVSADVIHAFHPNYASVYLEGHKPLPNTGISITLDANGHMATDAVGVALVEEIARKNGDAVQYFQIRNDSRSGGTIGPSISSQTGARTIDLGIPQLSMHSIRATTGSKDVGLGLKFFKGFFADWQSTYKNFNDL